MIKRDQQSTRLLFEALSLLGTAEEVQGFLEAICTSQEIDSFAQRFFVAKMLKENHVYSDIVADTGASTATISRVNRSMHENSESYRNVFEKLSKKN